MYFVLQFFGELGHVDWSSFFAGAFLLVKKLKKPPFIPKNRRGFYGTYMRSKEWKRKRKERLKFDGYECRGFHFLSKRTDLQVHHKSYVRLGNESVRFDLITLCKTHHKRAHKK